MRITKQLIDAVIDFQSKGFLHLDIKPSNIFLSDNEIWIGDPASFCKNDDISRKRQLQITSWYASPEYVKAMIQYKKSKNKVLKMMSAKIKDETLQEERKIADEKHGAMFATITEKYDMWSLGCTLYQLHYTSTYRLPWATSLDSSTVFEAISNLKEDWLSEPPNEDSIHHLIWSMLRIDPAQRISHLELQAFMERDRDDKTTD
jgi:serine/threonine protein kinase